MHEQWADRFNARVQKSPEPDGCWPWIGSRLPSGYGRFYPQWKVGLYAHRVAWEMANNKPVPEGLHVCHTCDNPSCVRPEHLFVGTRSDNMRDMVAKDRHNKVGLRGHEHPGHKLTEGDVKEIRRLRDSCLASSSQVAAQFGISKHLVVLIHQRKSWSWLPEATP